MTDSERIKGLKKQIRQLKKSGTGGGDFRVFIRLHVLFAYCQKQPIERIAKCYDISTKTINRWILRYESGKSYCRSRIDHLGFASYQQQYQSGMSIA